MNLNDSLSLFGLPSLEGQTEESLKKLYHSLAGKYHPDKGGSSEEFIALRKAYIYLRTALLDPTSKSYQSNYKANNQTNSQTNSQANSSHYHDQAEQDYYSDSNNQDPADNPYKEAYQKAVDQIKQYEDIFNAQVRIINRTNKDISGLYSHYSSQRDAIKKTLDDQLESLNKRYNRAWWEYIVPTPKLNRNEYITQHNTYVAHYNETAKQIDDSFMQTLLKSYQSGFERIIDYLK